MKKLLFTLFALVCLFAPGTRAQVAVTGNLKNLGVSNVTGSNSYARFTLKNYGSNLPKVTGSNVIVSDSQDFKPNGSGNISGSLQGNDTIDPSGTFYQVCIYFQGIQFRCANYLITGSGFDLNSAVPLTIIPNAGTNQLILQTFPCVVSVASTTWTCTHNFNDSPVMVNAFDSTSKVIFPDVVNVSNPNVTTLTFVTPHSGTALISHAGGISLATSQPNAVIQNPTSGQTIQGASPFSVQSPVVFTGNFTTSKLGAEIYPSGLVGTTCGDKIAAALALLPATGGILKINNACGLGTATSPWTAVSIPANVALQFIEPTNSPYWISSITMAGANASLYGPPVPMTANTTPLVQLKLGNGVNPTAMLTVNGAFAAIHDIGLDGNIASNATAGPNILVNNAARAEISGVTTGNSNSHGLRVFSTGTSNTSGGLKLFHLLTYQNNGDGVSCQGSADAFVSNSEFENNVSHGMNLTDCPTWRIEHNDFGANTAGGLFVLGTAAGLQSNRQVIIGNQFGNNFAHDIQITGFNTGDTSVGSLIVGNGFVGLSATATDNTFDAIRLIDGGASTITGNSFATRPVPHSYKYAIEITETGVGRSYPNIIDTNTYGNINFGTGFFSDVTSKAGIARINNLWSSPGNIESVLGLFDTTPAAATPKKYFRVSAGNLQLLNNAFGSIFILTDAGQLQIPIATGISPFLVNSTTPVANLVAGGNSITVASGTAVMTTALIGAGACSTPVTVSASGVLTTDAISFSYNVGVGANPGVLTLNNWVTANNVNFAYCNPTAAGVTPTAATLNFRVVR